MNKKNISYLKFNLLNIIRHPFYYILTLIFVVFVSVYFFVKQQFFTGFGSTDLLALFSTVPYICILLIPSICYKRSDSIYDDFVPLSSFKKIFIKFLSVFILYTVQILLLIPAALCLNLYGSIDGGQLFTSLFCLLFYGATVISVCILMNEIFENAITSFFISAVILAIFNSAHLFAVYASLGNFLTSFCKLISFAWHFDAAGKGIIDTRDIIWFIVVTSACLYISSLVKLKKAGKFYTKEQFFRISATFVILILVSLNCFRWFKRFDFSENKTYSISKYTKELISKIDDPVKITYYRSGTLSDLYPQIRDVSDFLVTFAGSSSNISYSVKNPDDDEQISALLYNYGITSQPMRSAKSTSVEYINVYSAITIEYNGQCELIPFILSAESLEFDLAGRLKHLLSGSLRVVNIIVGNDLSLYDSAGYNFVIPWLNSQGFVCNELNISDPSFADQLLSCTGPLLVIGDSQVTIDAAVAIENYILSEKGNAMFCVSPYSIDFTDWTLKQNLNTNLVEVLENWGVIFTDKIMADLSCSVISMESQGETEDPFTNSSLYKEDLNYPLFVNILPQNHTKLGVTVFWATALELFDNAKEYLITTPSSWYYQVTPNSPGKLIETNPFFLQNDNPSNKECHTQIAAAEITGPLNGLFNYLNCENSKIIVIPDQYFLNTTLVYGYIGGEYGDYRNFDFLGNCLLKLNNEEELAELQTKASRDTSLYKITTKSELQSAKTLTYAILFVILPLIIIIAAILINLLHMRKIYENKSKK